MTPYYMIFLSSFILCIVVSLFRRKRFGYSKTKAIILTLLLIPIGFVGAKLLFLIQNPDASFWLGGGLSFYGTVLFVPVEQIIVALIGRLNYADLMDFTAPYAALCLCITRIGCFVNGCCGAAPIIVNGQEVIIPLQLIESSLDLLLFIYLMWRECSNRILIKGEQTCLFTIIYAFIRLVMEYYRNTPKNIYGMSDGQWLAIITAVIAFIILNILRSKLRKVEKPTSGGEEKLSS